MTNLNLQFFFFEIDISKLKTRLEILLGLLCLITTPKVSIVWLFMLALKRKLHFRKHLYFKQFNYLIWINVQNQVFRSRKLDPRFLCFFQRKKSLSMTKSVSFFQLFFCWLSFQVSTTFTSNWQITNGNLCWKCSAAFIRNGSWTLPKGMFVLLFFSKPSTVILEYILKMDHKIKKPKLLPRSHSSIYSNSYPNVSV